MASTNQQLDFKNMTTMKAKQRYIQNPISQEQKTPILCAVINGFLRNKFKLYSFDYAKTVNNTNTHPANPASTF